MRLVLTLTALVWGVAASAQTLLQLAPTACDVRVFLDGKPLAAGAQPTELPLSAGLHVLALEASAQGNQPAVVATITSEGCAVAPGWLCRSTAPEEGWLTAPPGAGWEAPAQTGAGMWPAAGGARAWFAWALYVGEDGPQVFPKLDVFYLPRGSRQLLRLYLHAPMDLPLDDYTMVVTVPEELACVAVEPVSGGMPELSDAGAVQAAGRRLRRWAVAYDMIPHQGMEISLRWGDATNSTLAYMPAITGGGTFDWRRLRFVATAPPGAVSLHPLIIKWQNRGITGTFWVDNLSVHEPGSDENLLKMGSFDEPGWGSHYLLQPEGPDGSMCVKVVATPELVDKQQALWVDKEGVIAVEPGRQYVIEADVKCENLGAPGAKPLTGLLFEAPGDLPEGHYPLYTGFAARGITELPRRSRIAVLPPLKNKRPRYARLCPCYYESTLRNDLVAEAYAENCWASGITWTYGGAANNVVSHLLPRGHKVILSIGWGPWEPRLDSREFLLAHEELQALSFEGKRLRHKFCPTWMLGDSPEAAQVRADLESWLLTTVNAHPYFGANWDLEEPVVDPPTYCVCDRCIQAFRQRAGLATEVPVTPATLLAEHRDAWVEFRCAQNAQMAGLLRDMLRRAARPIEFSLYSGYQSKKTREHYGVDWAMMAPHLDYGIAGYNGGRQALQDTVAALGQVPFMGGEMWYLSPNDDTRPAPKMETWRNRLLRQFVDSGCHGVLIWYLPTMDGGAFYATSEAAEIIADYEDFFRAEQRCDQRVTVAGLEPSNWAAFAREGRVLVLLMSFSDQPGDVTVKVDDGPTRTETLEPYGARVLLLP